MNPPPGPTAVPPTPDGVPFGDRPSVRFKALCKGLVARVVPSDRVLWCRPDEPTRVALTFDDGPDPAVTPVLLDLLDRLDARATFFLLGERLEESPELGFAIQARGHELGYHGFRHVSLRTMANAEIVSDVRRSREVFEGLGLPRPTLYRPPLGEYRLRHLSLLRDLGVTVALWSADSRDFEAVSAADVLRHLRPERLKGGDILLFHDRFAHTVEAVGELIPLLRRRGLEPGTIGDLISFRSA